MEHDQAERLRDRILTSLLAFAILMLGAVLGSIAHGDPVTAILWAFLSVWAFVFWLRFYTWRYGWVLR